MKVIWRLYRYSYQLPLIDEAYHHIICTFRGNGSLKLILGVGSSPILALSDCVTSAKRKLALTDDECDVLFAFLYEQFGIPSFDDGGADEDIPF